MIFTNECGRPFRICARIRAYVHAVSDSTVQYEDVCTSCEDLQACRTIGFLPGFIRAIPCIRFKKETVPFRGLTPSLFFGNACQR